MQPFPSMSYILNAQRSFSCGDPRVVTDRAQTNSLKSLKKNIRIEVAKLILNVS